jgi:PhzF family phenazine biosynthesis protein
MVRTPRAAVSLSLRIWLVDAFAQQPFSGNPAGVCLLERSAWPTEDWMRSFAAELKSETAFVYRVGEASGGEWALRWFTAQAESNVCGHATLAAAHALRDEQPAHHAFSFRSPYGLLMARRREDGAITLDFPAASPVEAPTPAGLREALHGEPIATFGTGRLGDLLVVMRDEKTVRGLQPDFAALARLCRRDDV